MITGRSLVDVGTSIQQHFNDIVVTLPRRVQQRRQTAPAPDPFAIRKPARFRFLVFDLLIRVLLITAIRDCTTTEAGCGRIVAIFTGGIRHVRPFALNLSREIDRSLHFIWFWQPISTAAALFLELGEHRDKTLVSSLVATFHFGSINDACGD